MSFVFRRLALASLLVAAAAALGVMLAQDARSRDRSRRPPGGAPVAARRRARRHDVHHLPAPDRQVRGRDARGPRRRQGRHQGRREDPDELRRHLDHGPGVHRQGERARRARRTSRSRRRASRPLPRRPRPTSRSCARNTEPTRTISLERIEANLAITQADKKGEAVPLKNDPPKIIYRSTPAILVIIDGDPALRPVEGASGLQRVINTKSLILESGGTYYLALAEAWLQAPSAEGPYRRTPSPPSQVQAVHDAIAKDENQTSVDLMEEPGEEIEAVLAEGKAPEIIVSTVPGRASRHAGQAADEAHRRHEPPLRRQHGGRHVPGPRRPELLRRPHRPLVPRRSRSRRAHGVSSRATTSRKTSRRSRPPTRRPTSSRPCRARRPRRKP